MSTTAVSLPHLRFEISEAANILRSSLHHLRYIEREGVGREGERGSLYSTVDGSVSRDEFEQRGRGDRHH